MEGLLVTAVGCLGLTAEVTGAAVIGIGVLSTTFRYALSFWSWGSTLTTIFGCAWEAAWRWVKFLAGADVLGTAVSPTFEEVQLLAAIVWRSGLCSTTSWFRILRFDDC